MTPRAQVKLAHMIEPRSNEVVILRTRRAQAGDVILTLGPKMPGDMSRGIALLSDGPFSHAALWTGSVLYEAMIGRGIGPIGLASVRRKNLSTRDMLSTAFDDYAGLVRLPSARKYLWLRHPQMLKHLEPQEIEELLVTIKLFEPFAPIPSALDATVLSAKSKRILSRVFGSASKSLGIKPRETGAFCSQLVGMFFEAAQVPLFDPCRPSKKVSPNALLDSCLEPAPDVLMCCPSAEVDDTPLDALERQQGQSLSAKRLRKNVKRKARVRALEAKQKEILAERPLTLEGRARQLKRVLALVEQIRESISEQTDEIAANMLTSKQLLESCINDPLIGQALNFQHEFSLPMWITGSTTDQEVELKEAPRADARTLRTLSRSTPVHSHLQDEGRWLVRLSDGTTGYVARRLMSLSPPRT